jgi:Arc/MetJ-type ribon-helix-helix transcriptional regulator
VENVDFFSESWYDILSYQGFVMAATKIAITLDQKTLSRLDQLVKSNVFLNRSKAIQEAVEDKLKRLEQSNLARECAKLDRSFEQAMAEEGLSRELEEWPEY